MEKLQAATSPEPNSHYLPIGTILNDYIIEKELASGGFSSVYLARQISDQFQVAIKEYLPRRLAHRSGLQKIQPNDEMCLQAFIKGRNLFIEEARILAQLKHPNIVEVINFFKENSTVYMVMTYDYGKSLERYIIRDKRAHFSYDFLMRIYEPLLDGLDQVHQQGLLHLDVKPQNILIKPNGEPLLLDFGAAHHFRSPEKNVMGKVYTKGFSPLEQYYPNTPLGPWSDIYAAGATLRTCIDGAPPPPAKTRYKQDTLIPASELFKRYYPKSLLEVIDASLEIQPNNRPQSVSEIVKLLRT